MIEKLYTLTGYFRLFLIENRICVEQGNLCLSARQIKMSSVCKKMIFKRNKFTLSCNIHENDFKAFIKSKLKLKPFLNQKTPLTDYSEAINEDLMFGYLY